MSSFFASSTRSRASAISSGSRRGSMTFSETATASLFSVCLLFERSVFCRLQHSRFRVSVSQASGGASPSGSKWRMKNRNASCSASSASELFEQFRRAIANSRLRLVAYSSLAIALARFLREQLVLCGDTAIFSSVDLTEVATAPAEVMPEPELCEGFGALRSRACRDYRRCDFWHSGNQRGESAAEGLLLTSADAARLANFRTLRVRPARHATSADVKMLAE